MRLHVVAVFCHQLAHPLEVGLGKHDREELPKIVILPRRCFLNLTAKLVGEHLSRLSADLPDFRIDLRVPPVWRPVQATRRPLMSPLTVSAQLMSLGMVRRSRSSGPDAITLIINAP